MFAVAPAVTVMGRIVAPFINVMATRILADYNAVVAALRASGHDDAVPRFNAAWEELGSTPDGRAVIAVCSAAAEGGVLLGRVAFTSTAAYPWLEKKLATYYAGKEFLPVLLAAMRYYKAQTASGAAPPTTPCTAPEWPSVAALTPVDDIPDVPVGWNFAVAPAVVAVKRLAEPFLPELRELDTLPSFHRIVKMMQAMELDADVPKFQAAWEELGSTPDGRAVIAVSGAAAGGVLMGWAGMHKLAANPHLEAKMTKYFEGKDFLPVLLATARYYHAQTLQLSHAATAAAGGGSGGGVGGDAVAGGSGGSK